MPPDTKDHAITKALGRLERDVAAYREAVAAQRAAQQRLAAGVRLADKAGARQADILRAIDHEWTREYVRKLGKEAG